MADQTIEITLGENTKLIFDVREWRGRQFASIRKFVVTQKYQGWTKSGLSLNKKLLRELIALLAKVEKTLPPQEEHEFGRLPKSETEYIKIETLPSEEENGLPAVDVRKFVDSPAYKGPTKSGIRFRWNFLPDVLACLREQVKIMGEAEKNEPSLFGTGAFAESEPESEVENVESADGELAEIIGEPVKQFPTDFLAGTASSGMCIQLPDAPLRIEQDNTGAYFLWSENGMFCAVRNPVEANFIIYAQMRGHANVTIPKEMLRVFKTVKTYENYARDVQTKVVAKLTKKAGQRSVAEYEACKKMNKVGLPLL